MQVGARPDDDTRPIVGPSRSLATHPSQFIDMTPPYVTPSDMSSSLRPALSSVMVDWIFCA